MEDWRKRDNPGIIVQAIRLNEDNAAAAAAWCGAELVEEIDPEHPDENQPGLNLTTPTGTKRASLGMYVVKFGRAFFVAHNRQFELVYEPVNRPAPPPESPADSRRALGFGDPFDRGRMGP